MEGSEFLTIIAANANKCKNLRSYFGPWPPSILQVSDEVAGEFGRITAFLQAKIEAGHFCNKNTEYLLLYNFQLLQTKKDVHYYSLDMLRKPLSQIKAVNERSGEPVQLVIHGETGEIMNNSQAMIELEMLTLTEIQEEKLDPPINYGSYANCDAPCIFIALESDTPILAEAIFNGYYDNDLMLTGRIFENPLEAFALLAGSRAISRCLIELPFPASEIVRLRKQGLGTEVVKFIDYQAKAVIVNPNPRALSKEEPVEDELCRLKEAFEIRETEQSKKNRETASEAARPEQIKMSPA